MLRLSRPPSVIVLTRSKLSLFAEPRPLHSPQPNLQIQLRPPLHAPRADVAAESLNGVLVQIVTKLTDQGAAQSAAQIPAFSSMLNRFDDLRAAAAPMLLRPLLLPSALSAYAVVNANLFYLSAPSAPALVYQKLSNAEV